MLVLTICIEGSIMIGDNIKVKVLGIKGNQVRIGVEAPKEIPVHRDKIYERIQKEATKFMWPMLGTVFMC